MSFVDRSDAGGKLALALKGHKDENVVMLALPRGGVEVAVEVARYLGAPLDLLLVRQDRGTYPARARHASCHGRPRADCRA